MASISVTFTIDEDLLDRARQLHINISAAAREGVAAAVRTALADADRAAYQKAPDRSDRFWNSAEQWGDG